MVLLALQFTCTATRGSAFHHLEIMNKMGSAFLRLAPQLAR
jgi:hypothetical protein